ncbi:MAG: hypothetical protein HKO68_00460 [Desulfobacterales bacterium]|nr:hypothetical protein [Deltaproteobacteria bacterium]NNL74785.1 hypothetical protein [Desulfobacterales bacterium]
MVLKVNRLKVRLRRLCEMLPLSAVILIFYVSAYAQTVDLSGQASGWVTVTRHDTQVGLRYIPGMSFARHLGKTYEISVEAAVKAQWFSRFGDGWERTERDSEVDSYRLWARFAASQYEIRAGLQKISFGSATLLRPLMWFDSIDPRDPLQLTDGVYGILGRYYFLNNANIWLWGLYGNDDRKGWETLPSYEREIEFGGRLQIPVSAGEMGLSYHHRRVNPKGTAFSVQYPAQDKFSEQRFGLDGKWDIGVGLWLEGTVTRQDLDVPEPRYQKLFTMGTDYTFDVGNGPHLLLEQFVRIDTKDLFGSGESQSISAMSADYPLSFLDTVLAIIYYDWEFDEWSGFLTWRRTYDRWQLHLSTFRNPDYGTIIQDTTAGSSFSGNGVQLMLVFNH